MRQSALSTHLDLDLKHLIPEAAWEQSLLRHVVDAEVPNRVESLSGRTFNVHTWYDDRGWFRLALHADPAPDGTAQATSYDGLCGVVATTPPGVSVYFVLETRTGWADHLTSHARLEPEPAR